MTQWLLEPALWGLLAGLALAVGVWGISVALGDASIVDIAWGWLVCTPAIVVWAFIAPGARGQVALALALAWAVRLSLYIFWRHRGQPEDPRYRAIRERNEPNFEFKSLYLVFALQAVLGWIVAAPLAASLAGRSAWSVVDTVGAVLALGGLLFETVADAQLARFKSQPANRVRVMDEGLWRYSRHPNYFGEFCVWWGLGLMGLAAGAWWSLASPLLMSVLLLRVSGVTLLEPGLADRRPGYEAYVRRTNAFFPWGPRA